MSFVVLIGSVFLGVLFVLLIKPNKSNIQLLLSFSGAYLLSITVLHLLPEVFESGRKNRGIFILIGIVLQTVLEFFSKGAEHGHLHTHPYVKGIPWLLLSSLSLHAFFEGIPIGYQTNHFLLWAIAIHKIPISIVLFLFLKQSSLSANYVYLLLAIFSLMSPLGIIASNTASFFASYHIEITALIIGVFLHISTAILFETTENHQFNIRKFIAVCIGFGIALLGSLLV